MSRVASVFCNKGNSSYCKEEESIDLKLEWPKAIYYFLRIATRTSDAIALRALLGSRPLIVSS